jgi:hypothetical protein
MRANDVRGIDDATLLGRLHQLVARERAGTATLLAHLAEVEARKLYVPAGYSSMFDYCLREFRWTEDMAVKRLRVARCARRFPEIFVAIADGRLNVSGVLMLRMHLTPETSGELLAASFGRTRAELELMLAARFPKGDVPTKIRAIPTHPIRTPLQPSTTFESAPNERPSVETRVPTERRDAAEVAPGPVTRSDSAPVRPATPPAKLTPLSPERFAIQVTVDRETHALLRRAQELLSHQYRSGDVARVLHRALEQLVSLRSRASLRGGVHGGEAGGVGEARGFELECSSRLRLAPPGDFAASEAPAPRAAGAHDVGRRAPVAPGTPIHDVDAGPLQPRGGSRPQQLGDVARLLAAVGQHVDVVLEDRAVGLERGELGVGRLGAVA